MEPLIIQVILGACLGGFVQGLSGFAFGLVAMAFWAWAVAPQVAGPMVVFGSLVGQILTIGTMRRGFELSRVLPFIIGGAAGVPVGTLLLPHVNQTPFKAAVGLLLVVWCPTMLFARSLPLVRAGGRVADGGAGMLGGIMGGLGGLSGPAPILWCTLRGWGRDTQRSVFQAFNLAIHSFTMSAYLATGMVTAETAKLFAIVVPAMLVPNLIGARL